MFKDLSTFRFKALLKNHLKDIAFYSEDEFLNKRILVISVYPINLGYTLKTLLVFNVIIAILFYNQFVDLYEFVNVTVTTLCTLYVIFLNNQDFWKRVCMLIVNNYTFI